jgi:hypothetical protein
MANDDSTLPEVLPVSASDLAEIRTLQPPYYRQIMTTQTLVICNLLVLVPLLIHVAGLALALTVTFWWLNEAEQTPGLPIQAKSGFIAMIGVGGVLWVTGGYMQLRNGTYVANRYLKSLTRRVIRARPDSLIDSEDPEAIFVEIVPRKNWGRMMIETASDVGLFKVDESRGELRFEGDRETYRVPGQAILWSEIEEVNFGGNIPGFSITIFPTVVVAETASGQWEAPVVFRGDFGSLGAGKRRRRAMELRDKIQSIMPE